MIKHGVRGDTEESIQRKMTAPDPPSTPRLVWIVGAAAVLAGILWLWLR